MERFAAASGPVASVAHAFDPEDGLSLAEGELVALVFHPDLRRARLAAQASAVALEHAGRWDDPELELEVLRITESVPDPWIVAPSIAFTLPLSGRLGAERGVRAAELEVAWSSVAEREWEVVCDARRAWVRWSRASEEAVANGELTKLLRELTKTTGALRDAGELATAEAALFELELARAIQWQQALAGEQVATRAELVAALGLSPDAAFECLALEWRALEARETLELTHPRLARLAAQHEVAERVLEREIRAQLPDLRLGPLFESDEGSERVGVGFGWGLPLWNRNRAAIAAAEVEREAARAEYEAQHEELAHGLAATRARISGLADSRNSLEIDVSPLASRQLAAAQAAVELGEASSLVLLESVTRAHEVLLSTITARAELALAETDLSELLGPPAGLFDDIDARVRSRGTNR